MATSSSLQLLAVEAKDGAQTDRACAWRHVGGAAMASGQSCKDCYAKNVDLSHLFAHTEDFVKSLQAQPVVPCCSIASCCLFFLPFLKDSCSRRLSLVCRRRCCLMAVGERQRQKERERTREREREREKAGWSPDWINLDHILNRF